MLGAQPQDRCTLAVGASKVELSRTLRRAPRMLVAHNVYGQTMSPDGVAANAKATVENQRPTDNITAFTLKTKVGKRR